MDMDETKKFFLTIRLIHIALVMGLVLFGCITILLNFDKISLTPAFDNLVIIITGVFCIGSIGLSLVIPTIFTKVTPLPADSRSALMQYQVCSMMRWAVIEGSALFSCVVTLLTTNILSICFFAVSTALLIYRYPSEKEFLAFMGKRRPS